MQYKQNRQLRATLFQLGLALAIGSVITAPNSFAVTETAAAERKPNVLMIVIDDMNDWVGCLKGHEGAQTPNIDALARRGVLLTNAHCQAPICGPSRASFFTGLMPTTSGIYLQIGDRDIRDSNEATRRCVFLPDYLERHGYRTFGVGKLFHQGDRARCFDKYGGKFAGSGPKPKKRFRYDPAWYDKEGGTQTDWGAYPERDEEMTDYKAAQWAIKKLGQKHERPFFLAVGFVRPHVPWYAPPKWFERHPLASVKTPPYRADDMQDVPAMGRRVAEAPMMPTTEELIERGQWKEAVQAYLVCCTWTDHWVGEVVRALDASPQADNTVIVLWSDHGYHLGEKGRFAKQALWERDTRVPLIVAGPGIEPGRRCERPVGLIDVYPTLLELCGLPANSDNEGHSLAPLLADVRRPWDHATITAYGPVNFAVRSERYHYIRYEDGSEELYDMQADPNEWTNLAARPDMARVLQEHRQRVPHNPAPLARKSKYDFNAYFRARQDAWRRGETAIDPSE